VGFNAWFAALPVVLKLLVILGIVVGSLAVGASFVASTIRVWRVFGDFASRREKSEEKKRKQGSIQRPDGEEQRRDHT
jgi:uncharacterized membrane protein (DUF485 family)